MNICRKHEESVVVYGPMADDCPICRQIFSIQTAWDRTQLDLTNERATSQQLQCELDARVNLDDSRLRDLEKELARLSEVSRRRVKESMDEVLKFAEQRG